MTSTMCTPTSAILILVCLLSACHGFTTIISPTFQIATTTTIKNNGAAITSLQLAAVDASTGVVEVGEEIGKGSYGTVHFCRLNDSDDNHDNDNEWLIGKRSLTKEELQPDDVAATDAPDPTERAERCQYYWDVEEHCYSKLMTNVQDDDNNSQVPNFKGSDFRDEEGRRWMLFDIVPSNDCDSKQTQQQTPAPSLTDLMKLDHDKQHDKAHPHHLYHVQQALGIKGDDDDDEDISLGQVLDVFLQSLLQALSDIHAQKLVHRDIKPGNLLLAKGVVTVIDFGSAADLEPAKGGVFRKKYVGLEDGNRVAVSPIYAAPELFIDPIDKPENFDVFSAALIYCQLLFNLLDSRTDAGFHQQLASTNPNAWDLDAWLQQELASTVRPQGLEEALVVLSERPGLWRLLTEMFRPEPWYRISSKDALKRLKKIVAQQDMDDVKDDGPFLQSVLESFEICEVLDFDEEDSATSTGETATPNSDQAQPKISRPLHFLASFKRKTSLGLILSEVGNNEEDDDDDDDDEMSDEERAQWVAATKDALPGQVFVKGIVEKGQADDFGIFEIGDQLQGVGELPVAERGFEKVVDLLGKQPQSAKFVTLHFDRKNSASTTPTSSSSSTSEGPVYPKDSGAWSSKGRRKSQEDRFVLHEILDSSGRSVLVAGVFDGHGGPAASKLAADEMPGLVTDELFRNKDVVVDQVLGNAWETISSDYQQACESELECSAEYDEREGSLDANTGAADLVAGTTATVAALDESTGKISFLNCGDSRTLLINKEGKVVFHTTDHTPVQEMGRLKAGNEEGLGYSIPECSVSKWFLKVGDYQYAVARSLEGPFATSKGIISLPDITSTQAESGFSILCASDGLWDVMDSGEVARVIATMRNKGSNAGDAAKTLCSMAIEKGTSDNVSAVIVYLE